ncbi:MAG: 16S rRNA (guanine(527)-N(7))-methyltransferase RsmG [Bryobacteraceae bacterium]
MSPFREALARFGAGLVTAEQAAMLERHYDLLIRWNRRLNLTSVTGVEDLVKFHYCESLALAEELPRGALRIVDVGSGAGFPGFPVAVSRPECEVTLVESRVRRAVFLREVSRDLANVRVLACRAESLNDRFDWLVARAVSSREILSIAGALADQVAILSTVDSPLRGSKKAIKLPWGRSRAIVFPLVPRDAHFIRRRAPNALQGDRFPSRST